MGWDSDDDWENENLEEKLEKNRVAKEKAQKRLETGEDESSEEEEEEEEEKKEVPKAKKSTWEQQKLSKRDKVYFAIQQDKRSAKACANVDKNRT